MPLNWSQGFERGAQGLALIGENIGKRELAAAVAAREENLERLRSGTQIQIAHMVEGERAAHEESAQTMWEKRNAANVNRSEIAASERERVAYRAQDEMARRNAATISAHDEAQLRLERGRVHMEWRKAIEAATTERTALLNSYNKAVQANPSVAFQTDPQKRAQAIAADPTLSQMADALQAMRSRLNQINTSYTMHLASLGDPVLSSQGVKTPPTAPPAPGGGAPDTGAGNNFSLIGGSGPPSTPQPGPPLAPGAPDPFGGQSGGSSPLETPPTNMQQPPMLMPPPVRSRVGPAPGANGSWVPDQSSQEPTGA